MKAKLIFKGGPGSGHHGHSGRPGKVGGSAPGKGGGGSSSSGGSGDGTLDKPFTSISQVKQALQDRVKDGPDSQVGVEYFITGEGGGSKGFHPAPGKVGLITSRDMSASDRVNHALTRVNDAVKFAGDKGWKVDFVRVSIGGSKDIHYRP